MSGTVAIFRRELSGLFFQPLAWVLLFLALLFNGYLFTYYVQATEGDVTESMLLSLGQALPFWGVLCVLAPLITMRMISEESRNGVLEFLLTAPVTDAAVVTGKLLAATFFFAVLWASVPIYGVVVDLLGTTPDWGQLLTAYGGSVLLSGFFCALGLFASTLTSTPALAAFLGFLLNIGFLLLPLLQRVLIGVVSDDALESAVAKVDVMTRFQSSFMVGALDTGHLVFFLAWTGALLFATVRLLETRRWS